MGQQNMAKAKKNDFFFHYFARTVDLIYYNFFFKKTRSFVN